jgi:hypothetical protein
MWGKVAGYRSDIERRMSGSEIWGNEMKRNELILEMYGKDDGSVPATFQIIFMVRSHPTLPVHPSPLVLLAWQDWYWY